MRPDFDYNLIPYSFVHCLNGTCLHANECLRYLATLRMPKERSYVNVINPAQFAPSGENCPHFKADRPKQFAEGMTHLLDHIPHNDALAIKQHLLRYFGRNHYYRLWRKERLFTPGQQEYIRNLFLQKGIPDAPVFDRYVEEYDWLE